MNAYQRMPNESAPAFAAYCEYRDMGPERSIRKAARQLGKSHTIVSRWSSKYRWVERAAGRDDFIQMIVQKAVEDHERAKAVEMVDRQYALKEKAVGVAEKLAEQMEDMVAWPLEKVVRKEDEETGEVTVVHYPAKWSKRTIRDYFEMVMLAVDESGGEDGARMVGDMERTVAEMRKRREQRAFSRNADTDVPG